MTALRSPYLALPLALLLGLPAAASAQVRNLDTEPSSGKIVAADLGSEDAPATFTLTLAAGQAIELEALPVGDADPQMRVFEVGASQPLAENDDRPGSLAARVRLFSETRKALRIEVFASPTGAEAQPGARFRLIASPSDYRPLPVLDLAPGARHRGTLESGDEQLFRFRGEPGQSWTFALEAPEGSAFDPLLEVYAGSAVAGEPLASDDDGGGELNSRLRFRVPRAGDYTLRVTSAGRGGAWELSARSGEAVSPAGREAVLDLDRPLTGELPEDDGEQLYRLSDAARARLAAGVTALVVEMTATGEGELDPLLEAGFETPLGFSVATSDDDGGGGLDSRLVVDLGGIAANPDWLQRFRIRARSASESGGEYEITLSQE